MIKFTVGQLALAKALQGAERFATGIHTGGNLAELTLRGPQLTIRTTDLTHEFITQIPYEGNEGNETLTFTTPVAPLHAYVSKLSDGTIRLEVDDTSLSVKGTQTRAHSRFGVSDSEAVPQGFALDDTIPWAVGGDLPFSTLSKLLAFAVENPNGNRPALQGVYATPMDGHLEWVATDGSRLARWKSRLMDFPPALFPVKTIQEMGRWASLTGCRWSDKIAEFHTETTTLRVRLLAGQYPDYQRVIPDTFMATLTVETSALRAALDRVMTIMANRESDPLYVTRDAEHLHFAVTTTTGHSEEDIPLQEAAGEFPEILFNPRFLLEGLRGLPEDSSLHLAITGPQSPMRITNAEVWEWDYIVLPLRQLT